MSGLFAWHAKTPPLEPLRDVVARLEARGLVCALGGSGLLAALRLEDSVRDWDVTTDAPIEAVRDALAGTASTWKGSDEIHADLVALAGVDRVVERGRARLAAGDCEAATLLAEAALAHSPHAVPALELAIASHDTERYLPTMSTDFLVRIGEIVTEAVSSRLP